MKDVRLQTNFIKHYKMHIYLKRKDFFWERWRWIRSIKWIKKLKKNVRSNQLEYIIHQFRKCSSLGWLFYIFMLQLFSFILISFDKHVSSFFSLHSSLESIPMWLWCLHTILKTTTTPTIRVIALQYWKWTLIIIITILIRRIT